MERTVSLKLSTRRRCPNFVNSILQVPPQACWRRGCYTLIGETRTTSFQLHDFRLMTLDVFYWLRIWTECSIFIAECQVTWKAPFISWGWSEFSGSSFPPSCARTLKKSLIWQFFVPPLSEELEAMAGHNILEALSLEVLQLSKIQWTCIGSILQKVENVLAKPGWSALRQVSCKLYRTFKLGEHRRVPQRCHGSSFHNKIQLHYWQITCVDRHGCQWCDDAHVDDLQFPQKFRIFGHFGRCKSCCATHKTC